MNLIHTINNEAGLNIAAGDRKLALPKLQQAETLIEGIKKQWYDNQVELGDLFSYVEGVRAMTSTYNNLACIYKTDKKFNLAVKYLK